MIPLNTLTSPYNPPKGWTEGGRKPLVLLNKTIMRKGSNEAFFIDGPQPNKADVLTHFSLGKRICF